MADRVIATGPGPLFEVLAAALPGWSRNTLRQRLSLGCVLVNGTAVRRGDHPVQAGDVLEVAAKAAATVLPGGGAAVGLPRLFEDDLLVAIDKPVRLLSVATDDGDADHALGRLRLELGRPGAPAPLWPVHRLDRETSGVLLFARQREVQEQVQAAWGQARKTYLAVVDGAPPEPAGSIEVPLWEDRNLRVRAGDHPTARPARTRYRTLRRGRGRTLLEVELDTGRKHQIRAHLAWLGCPIAGDDRYGAPAPRLGLHAASLELPHPRDGHRLHLQAPPPAAFQALLGPAERP